MKNKLYYLVLVLILGLSFNLYAGSINNIVKEKKLSQQEIDKISLFLSNFTEVRLYNFDIENYDEQRVLDFGIEHNYLNNKNSKIKDAGKAGYLILIDDINESIKKYFGIDYKNEYNDKNSGYTFKTYEHEVNYVKIDKVFDKGNGELYCEGRLYNINHKDYLFGYVKAIIKKAKYKDKDVYNLIELKSDGIEE